MKQFDDMPKAFRKSKYIFVYLMVSLAIVNFIVFYVVVNLNSLLLAFREFIGYDENYVEQYVWSWGNFKSMILRLTTREYTLIVWDSFTGP